MPVEQRPIDLLGGKKYLKVSLLIIDEKGFQAMTRQEATLFFRPVSYRYQRGSTLITKAVKDWPEILAGDKVMTAALLDRSLHRCHVLNLKGRSYGLREMEKAAEVKRFLSLVVGRPPAPCGLSPGANKKR